MLSKAGFTKLLEEIQTLLTDAKEHRSVEGYLVHSYWTIGQRIAKTGVLDEPSYGQAVIKNLSDALEVDERTLQRSVAFVREYSEPPDTPLNWAHYRVLLTLSDPKERAFYEKLAVAEGLSRDRLVSAIASDLHVSSSKKKGKGKAIKLKRPATERYTYAAQLLRVVDGDTLLFRLDLGFEVLKEQRVRLALVNTFSADSEKGREATLYVAARLSLADRIVLHTQRADLHGRYLGHVFYSTKKLSFSDTFHSGHYLNQQLLSQKLAMKMR